MTVLLATTRECRTARKGQSRELRPRLAVPRATTTTALFISKLLRPHTVCRQTSRSWARRYRRSDSCRGTRVRLRLRHLMALHGRYQGRRLGSQIKRFPRETTPGFIVTRSQETLALDS